MLDILCFCTNVCRDKPNKGMFMTTDGNQLIVKTAPGNITDIQRKVITDSSLGPSYLKIYVQYIVKTNTDVGTLRINSVWDFHDFDAKRLKIKNSSKAEDLCEKSIFETMELYEFSIKSQTVDMWSFYDKKHYVDYKEQRVMTEFFKMLNGIYDKKTNSTTPTLTQFILDVAERRYNDMNEYCDAILARIQTK